MARISQCLGSVILHDITGVTDKTSSLLDDITTNILVKCLNVGDKLIGFMNWVRYT